MDDLLNKLNRKVEIEIENTVKPEEEIRFDEDTIDTEEVNKEPVEQKKAKQKPKRKNFFRGILDGTILTRDWVVRQMPFVLFMTALAIVYIANRFHAETLVRKSEKLKKEIKDLKAESITVASELMFSSNQTEVVKLVEENEIEISESKLPPIKIEIREKENNE